MDNKFEKFNKRQKLKKSLKEKKGLYVNKVDETLIEDFLKSKVDKKKISEIDNFLDNRYNFNLEDSNTSNEDVESLLNSLSDKYDKERLNLLLGEIRNTVLENIIKPFGIAKYVLVKYDKEGGNVDTVNNVRKNVYATKSEKEKSDNNPDYDSDKFHRDKKYTSKNGEGSKKQRNNQLYDEYTGRIIQHNEKSNLDHTISANEIHLDKGRILADLDEIKLANDKSNLNHTLEIINKKKKQKSMKTFVECINTRKDKTELEIIELLKKENPTIEEIKRLEKLNQINNFDSKLALEKDEIARKAYNKEINSYYKSPKFIKNTISSSSSEGAKMGLQQAIGVVLKELTERIFDEIFDIYKNGFKGENKLNETFFNILKERLSKIASNVLHKWQDVVSSFGEGFLSGFLSNLVTVVVNMFVTTGKRVVRMIREGFFSLLKALRFLLSPPEGMSYKEAMHEATKLLVAGFAITGGIILEQYLEILLKSIPFADLISSVIIGILTGLATSLLIFLLDKLDIFGAIKEKRSEYVINELDKIIDNSIEDIESILQSLEVRTI